MRPLTHTVTATSLSERIRAIHDIRFKEARVRTISNGIDCESWSGAIAPQKSNTTYVGYVGRLDFQKNPKMFLRVAKLIIDKNPNIRFLMIGFGAWDRSGESIKAMIRNLGLYERFELVHWIPHDEVLRFMKKCALVMVTSRYESFGYVAAEAMAAGKPVIVTNVDGLKDIVEHSKSGFIVELNDDESMAKYALKLLNDPRLSNDIGMEARKRVVENFEIRKKVKQLETFYEKTIDQ